MLVRNLDKGQGDGMGTFLPITPRQAIEGIVVIVFAGL